MNFLGLTDIPMALRFSLREEYRVFIHFLIIIIRFVYSKLMVRFLNVLRIDPSDAYALESLAIARFQQGYTEVAIKDLVFFLEEYPNSSRDSELRTLLASYQGESQSEVDKVQ